MNKWTNLEFWKNSTLGTSKYFVPRRVIMNRKLLMAAIAALGLVSASQTKAVFMEVGNDTLSWADGEIIASSGSGWQGNPGANLEYTVSFDADSGTWWYQYAWSASVQSLTYLIISVTESGDLGPFDDDNILDGTSVGEIGTYSSDPSAPGLPDDMYGIKFDAADSSLTAYFEIFTDRGPMWGDFYATGQTGVYAYNAGFGEDNEIGFNPDGTLANYIADQMLVPDSFESQIPEPSPVWLIGIGSGLIGLIGIFRHKRTA
jgi:hypothetical protein